MQTLPYIVISTFIVLILLGLSIVNFSTDEALRVLKKYEINISSDRTSLELISLVAKYELNKIVNVSFENGKYIDRYNHSNNMIVLSKNNSNSTTISSLTVTAHELGHAIQFNRDENKYKKFVKYYMLSNIVSKLFAPLILASIILLFFDNMLIYSIVGFGVALICFIISLKFKLANMKIEKEASEIAIKLLERFANFDSNNIKASKEILKSAYNTYFADFLKSLLKWTMLTHK